MFKLITLTGLALLMLTVQQQPPAKQEPPANTGTLTGEIVPSSKIKVTRPVKVVLLNEEYTNLYDGEALRRIDEYWERFKDAFIREKELFIPVSQLAQSEAIQFVLDKMRRDGLDFYRMTRDSSPDGKFEFRNLPLGEYKVVAFGSVGNNDFVWQGWVNLESSEPVNIELKTTAP